jgi:hypothetical protein
MAGQSTDRTLGGGLQNIAKLESSIGWTKFNREIRDYLTMNGFGDLLGRNKAAPVQGTLTADAHATKEESWLDKQERAIAIVHSRCGYNARDEIKGKTVLNDVFLTLQRRYRPTGSAIFQQLDRRYYDLTLADCKNVSDFAEKLREARNELLDLDDTCLIGEPHFVNKFLTGLGSSFDIFLTSFYQNHALIPVRDENRAITTIAVTFEEAFIAAEKEEQSQRVREDKAALVSVKDTIQTEILYCSHCNKRYHTKDKCFLLRPDLKKAFDEKRDKKNRQKKRNSQKRSLQERDRDPADEDTEMEDSPTIYAKYTSFTSTPTHVPASTSEPFWSLPENDGVVSFDALPRISGDFISANIAVYLGHADKDGDEEPASASATLTTLTTPDLDERFAFMATQFATEMPDFFVVDSGCTQHASCKRQNFASLRPYDGKALSGIGGKKLMPQGIGTAKIECEVGGERIIMLLNNTLFCPELGCNLVSVSQLLDTGAGISFKRQTAIITHGQRRFQAQRYEGIWIFNL